MPLSNLFKKPAQKDPVRNDPFGSPEMQKKRHDAALEFLGVLQEQLLSADGKGHAGTTLSIAAWMAGTSLYRSLNYKHHPEPGHIMLSDEVNDAWPQLINLFIYYCKRNGIELNSNQWVIKTPEEHKPHMEILQAQETFQDTYNEVMKKHGLNYLDGARAGMIVCSVVFQYHCTRLRDIDMNVAAGIISMGVVTGAKTVPMPLNGKRPGSAPGSDKLGGAMNDLIKNIAGNSTDGEGSRLVLGEGMQAMDEALRNGGKYILVHPEVTRKLEENNIDPFLIHEAALKKELSSRISRIDFINGEVDQVLGEWQGKPERQIPVHIRQLLWLQQNAETYGYVRRGNGWVLK